MQIVYLDRAEELYETGVSRYLEKTDFDISQWLTEEELEEYRELN